MTRYALAAWAIGCAALLSGCTIAPNHNIIDVRSTGAVGNGRVDDTAAIQRAIDEAAARGRTVRLSGKRTYLCGQLRLRPNTFFRIERGAVLMASTNRSAYPGEGPLCLLVAENAPNIIITGGGEIHGQGIRFMERELEHIYRPGPWRPGILHLLKCDHLAISDITIRDSAHWAIHLVGCQGASIARTNIFNNLKIPNCDGIDPDHCRDVRITDCRVEAGDDCIVVKNTRQHADLGPSEKIVVERCALRSSSAALKIGTESAGDFRDIRFQNCRIEQSNRGMAIQLRDEGNVENILFSDIILQTQLHHDAWWGKAEPIHISAHPRTPGGKVGAIRNITFRNITARSENGIFLAGSSASRPAGLVLENVRLTIDRWTQWPGGRYDRRPGGGEGIVEHKTAGLFCDSVADVLLRQVQILWGSRRPGYFGHAIEVHDVGELNLDRFQGDAAHPQDQAIVSTPRSDLPSP